MGKPAHLPAVDDFMQAAGYGLPRINLLRTRVDKAISPPGHTALHRIAGVPSHSEHGVVVRRALRYGLQHVPVLDHLAVL